MSFDERGKFSRSIVYWGSLPDYLSDRSRSHRRDWPQDYSETSYSRQLRELKSPPPEVIDKYLNQLKNPDGRLDPHDFGWVLKAEGFNPLGFPFYLDTDYLDLVTMWGANDVSGFSPLVYPRDDLLKAGKYVIAGLPEFNDVLQVETIQMRPLHRPSALVLLACGAAVFRPWNDPRGKP